MRNIVIIFAGILIALSQSACKKSTYPPQDPVFSTGDTSDVLTVSATVTGKLTTLNGNTISAAGHCWSSVNQVPDWNLNEGKTVLPGMTAPGNFKSSLTSLKPNTVYYVRAFLITQKDTLYADIITLNTGGLTSAKVTTGAISAITYTTATAAGSITSIGNSAVTQYGLCWSSTNINPGLSDNKTQLGAASGPVSFSSNFTGLTPGTLYYVRAYATNGSGTAFGNVVSFSTTAYIAATVVTGGSSGISFTGATLAGSITATGNTTITQYGHCYSATNSTPTVSDAKTQLGTTSGTGSFSSVLTGLQVGTTYYMRAYATNTAGVAYGSVSTFTTTAYTTAAVTTGGVSAISFTGATLGGNLTSLGNTTVTQYGHCYSATNSTPTTTDSKTQLGTASATGSFSSALTGLAVGTKYYMRAYAINTAGTVYGAVTSFTTTAYTAATVTTGTPSLAGTASASIPCSVTSVGNTTITQYGICYSTTNATPTTADTKTQHGSTTTTVNFTDVINSPTLLVTYYVRAYATNSAGTSYGVVQTFVAGKP